MLRRWPPETQDRRHPSGLAPLPPRGPRPHGRAACASPSGIGSRAHGRWSLEGSPPPLELRREPGGANVPPSRQGGAGGAAPRKVVASLLPMEGGRLATMGHSHPWDEWRRHRMSGGRGRRGHGRRNHVAPLSPVEGLWVPSAHNRPLRHRRSPSVWTGRAAGGRQWRLSPAAVSMVMSRLS